VRAKYLVFAFILAMTGYVLYHNERFLVQPENPIWAHYSKYSWWLLTHGVAGASALLLAPMQFSDRLRARYTKLHRITGRIYVAGALVLAPLGAYIQYMAEGIDHGPRSFTTLAAVDAAMLSTATLIALIFALRRRITQHRQWMTRSYAIALVFFEGRFILGLTGLETAGVDIVQAVIWTCLALSVLLADIVIDAHEIRVAATARARVPSRPAVAASVG